MNILFILDNLKSNCGANVGIALELVKSWKEKGHNISCITRQDKYRDISEDKKKLFDSVWTFYSDVDEVLIDLTSGKEWQESTSIKKALKVIISPYVLSRYYDKKYNGSRMVQKAYANIIKEICDTNQFDAVIAVTEPFAIPMAMVDAKVKTNLFAIMFDSYSSNLSVSEKKKEKARMQEQKLINACQKVFALDFVYDDMDYLDSNSKSKMVSFSIPRVTHNTRSKNNNDIIMASGGKRNSEKVNFVYTGLFHETLRHPEYMMRLFSMLPDNYVLHVYGGGCDTVLNKYKELMKDRLILHGWVGSDEIPCAIENGDILINLNNQKRNMLPSKLIEYIDTGKPILNICKLEDCPSLKYMRKYPLNVSVIEGDNDLEVKEKVIAFVEKAIGKKINHNYIEECFKECTIDFVSEVVLNEIEKETK